MSGRLLNSEDPIATSPRRLRVLIVAPSLDILGGQAVQAAALMSRLSEEALLEIGFLPVNPRLPGLLRKLQAIKYVRTVVTSIVYCATLLARVQNYDIVHVFSASYFSFLLAPTPAILISKLYGKKILLNYHSGEAEDHLRRWRRSAMPTIRLVDELAVPSDYLVKVFAQFGLKARPIFNLVETDKFNFRGRTSLRPVFLSNRNLEPHYGVDQVLRAFAVVQQRFADATLTIVGEGSQRGPLEELCRNLGLRNTRFLGQVSHEMIIHEYHSADIYLNGSEVDNQPLSILEAFACGLPVVTTDAGGIPDMVKNEDTGFIVASGDYQAMADRAIRLLEEPHLGCQMAERAHKECRKYSWQSLRGTWLSCYQDVVSSRKCLDLQPVRDCSRQAGYIFKRWKNL
jgi:glycosyltransferase involved in cell wall biosynthesis